MKVFAAAVAALALAAPAGAMCPVLNIPVPRGALTGGSAVTHTPPTLSFRALDKLRARLCTQRVYKSIPPPCTYCF